MTFIQIELIDPRALKLLKDLEEMNIIKMNEDPSDKLLSVLKKIRMPQNEVPDDEEILKEVKQVRAERYGR